MLEPGSHIARIRPAGSIIGIADVPSDKSIAHRAAIFSAIAEGTSRIVDYPASGDPASTLACLRALGVEMYEEDDILVVEGKGLHGLREAAVDLDCGNSGTTMRLLSGLLAGQMFSSTLTGDESLSGRDMSRIADPLRKMGAEIRLDDNHAPILVRGGRPANSGRTVKGGLSAKGGLLLKGIEYTLPIPSAQVKSAVLLAGLYADGETSIVETLPSRDHTERMLGLTTVDFDNRRIVSIEGGRSIRGRNWSVPRDFSAAAFFIVAAAILPDSALRIPRIGLNPTRTGLLDVLMAMGAKIYIENERSVAGETVGDLVVFSSQLSGIELGGAMIPNIIDEIPILAVAAACAEGNTLIRDAGELRNKESDRISAITTGLSALGAAVEEREDGMLISGGGFGSGDDAGSSGLLLDSLGDHRIAMALGVAALAARGPVSIRNANCADVSFPGFWQLLSRLVYAEPPA